MGNDFIPVLLLAVSLLAGLSALFYFALVPEDLDRLHKWWQYRKLHPHQREIMKQIDEGSPGMYVHTDWLSEVHKQVQSKIDARRKLRVIDGGKPDR